MLHICRLHRRPFATALLAALAVGLPCLRAGEAGEDLSPEEKRDRAVCARAAASPVTLLDAVEQETAAGRVALAAAFRLEGGQLALTVVTVGAAADASDFIETNGAVGPGGWSPTRRALTEPAQVAQAARGQVLLAQTELTLGRALAAVSQPTRVGTGSAVPLPLLLEPRLLQRRPVFASVAALDGVPWTGSQDLVTGMALGSEPPAYVKARAQAARQRVGRPLPALTVPGGRWLNVEGPPPMAGWGGEPVLVLITNFACEMECGPSAETVSKWARVYGKRGLRVLTIYREREEWNPRVTLDEAAARVKQARTVHPVLLDPEDHFLGALAPGPVGYPVAYVVGRDGLVAWESVTSLLTFESDCVRAIETALAAPARPPAPSPEPLAPAAGGGR